MARPPTTELDPLISQYQHESQRSRADQALFMLKKIGSMVKPIMRQRSWNVGVLAEFYPNETNLLGLNINRGQKINLRLRYPGDVNQFLPLEQVVDTMLHELCHIAIGPHNAEFHALWDQLRDEHEALLRKGYTGEGFLGTGQRLGGRGRVPLHEARRIARAAAERRKTLTAGSGQRLGGGGIQRGQDARAVIAAAVERRNRVERGCASGTAAGARVARDEAVKTEPVTTTRAEREDEDERVMLQAYIDLIQEDESSLFGTDYVRPSPDNPAGPRGRRQQPSLSPAEASKLPRTTTTDGGDSNEKARSLLEKQRQIELEIERRRNTPSSTLGIDGDRSSSPYQPTRASIPETPSTPTSTPSRPPPPTPDPSIPQTWTCEICTLVNPLDFLTCDACTVERPAPYAALQDSLSTSTTTSQRPQVSGTVTKQRPAASKPRSSAYDSAARFEAERRAKVERKPVGWRCGGCGNFMEDEWWTCAGCGRMKTSS